MRSSLQIFLSIFLWTALTATAAKSSSRNSFFFPRLFQQLPEETPKESNKRPRFFSSLLKRTPEIRVESVNVADGTDLKDQKKKKRRRNKSNKKNDETETEMNTTQSKPFSFFRRAPATVTTVSDTPATNATKGFRMPWQRRMTTSPESSQDNITTTSTTTDEEEMESSSSTSLEESSAAESSTADINTQQPPKKTWGIFRKRMPTRLETINTTVSTSTNATGSESDSPATAVDDEPMHNNSGTMTLNATSTNDTSILSKNQTTKDEETPHSLPATPNAIMITSMPYRSSSSVPHRYYRKQTPGETPTDMLQQNSVLLAEIVVSILGTVTRLWLLTWLTRRLASQEEVIQPTQHFCWERLNDRFQRDSSALSKALQAPPAGISSGRWKRDHIWKVQSRKRQERLDLASVFTRTVVVVELSDDPKEGISLEQMPDLVTFLLQQHRSGAFGTQKRTGRPMEVEVVFLVQSPGGGVSTFGLAASQMRRLSKVEGITTTAVVDKVAASGGYMIASQAHKLLAAPFSSLGSIGVMMEGLNFNELAERYGIKPLIVKAGTNKNSLSTFGRVSDKDIRHEEARLAAVHEAFKELVVEGRPALGDMLDRVADGSVFLGKEAFDLQMIDGIMTSDEYILERIFASDRVLKLYRSYQARMPRRMMQISPWDLLPHLKAWIKQVDAKQITGLLAAVAQIGGLVGIAQQMLASFQVRG